MASTGLKLLAILSAMWAGSALCQTPEDLLSKPITIQFASGGPGSLDVEFRLHVEALRQIPNTPTFTFDFKGGSGGILAARYVVKSAPTGHTLFATASQVLTLPLVNTQADFDANKDFAPIMLLSKRSYMILVHPSAPFKDLPGYLAYTRSHPGELFWGNSGSNGSSNIAGLMLHSQTNTKISYVFYKRPDERLTDLMAGRIHVTTGTILSTAALVKSGKLRAIAQTGEVRSPLMADLPTVAEQGVKGYEYVGWLGLLAPAKTPPAVINKLNGYFQQSSKSELVVSKMKETDTTLVASTPEAFGRFLREETDRMAAALKASGITPTDDAF